MKDFVLVCDSACDLPNDFKKELNVDTISLVCNFKGKEYFDDGESLSIEEFYQGIRDGEMPTTSQINTYRFVEFFTPYAEKGVDVLYLAFSSHLSGTYASSLSAKNELLEKYPDFNLQIVDTRSASLGYGLLVSTCAEMKKEGKSLEEVMAFAEENKFNLHHIFTVDDLNHLKRGGRVSATAAVLGSILGIKPVLYMPCDGSLQNFSKARGRKAALKELIDTTARHIKDAENQRIFISHSQCIEDANWVAKELKEKFNVKDVYINSIGVVIGAHTGIGTIAVFFYGDNREPVK